MQMDLHAPRATHSRRVRIRIKDGNIPWKLIGREAALLAACFLLSQARAFNGLAPLSMAVLGAALLLGYRSPGMLVGCLLGRLSDAASFTIPAYADASALLISYLAFPAIKRFKKFKPWLLITAALLIPAISMRWILGTRLTYDWLLFLAQSAMGLAMLPALRRAVLVIKKRGRERSAEDVLCVCIALGAALMGAAPIQWQGISPALVLSIALLLWLGRLRGAALAGSGALAIGILISLGGGLDGTAVGALAFAAFAAALANKRARALQAIVFILAAAVATFYLNGSTYVLLPLKNSALSCVLFILTPGGVARWLEKSLVYVSGLLGERSGQDISRREVKERLDGMARAMSNTADNYQKRLRNQEVPPRRQIEQIMEQVVAAACQGCAMMTYCWERDIRDTNTLFSGAMRVQAAKGQLSHADMPAAWSRRCMRKEAFFSALQEALRAWQLQGQWRERLHECRLLVCSQMKGVSQVAKMLSDELEAGAAQRSALGERVHRELESAGVRVRTVKATERAQNAYVRVLRQSCGGLRDCVQRGAKAVSLACGQRMYCRFEGCAAKDGYCENRYECAGLMRVKAGMACAARTEDGPCGDSMLARPLPDGRFLLALSDGMGSGQAAADESAQALSLIGSFYEAGFARDVIYKSVNQLLMLKPDEEMFATVDVCLVDCYAQEANFTKIGAVPSYLQRDGRIEAIRAGALPMGIVEQAQPAHIMKKVAPGDSVILISDGIFDVIGEVQMKPWLEDILRYAGEDPEACAQAILESAQLCAREREQDDMSVLVAHFYFDE